MRTHGVESDVVFDGEVMNAVGSDCTIICVVHTAIANVRLINSPDHVEMDRVPTKLVRLACVPYFDVLYTAIRQCKAFLQKGGEINRQLDRQIKRESQA